MAGLVEAVGVALEQRYALGPKSKGLEPRTPITEQRGLLARMHRIMDRFGGRAEPSARRRAAQASGVPYSTWNHALAGRNVSKKTLGKIGGAFAKLVTAPARALRVKKRGLPSVWQIKAVVVCQPNGSRYINGQPAGASLDDIDDPTTGPEYREFNAEGLDSGRIVDAWLTQGAGAATDALLQEIEDNYGDEFGFEGDHVEVNLFD